MISGGLASPKPPDDGEPEEHGDEENEKESRGGIQGQGGRGGMKGDNTLTELMEHCGRAFYPDHGLETSRAVGWTHVFPSLPKARINPR